MPAQIRPAALDEWLAAHAAHGPEGPRPPLVLDVREPAELQVASVRPDAAFELDYRRRVLAFMDRVRAAETAMTAGGVESWVAAWDDDHVGNPQARTGR